MLHEPHNHIDQSNIGFKMLLGLGWSGGPLGANQDGIAEPIRYIWTMGLNIINCMELQPFFSLVLNYELDEADWAVPTISPLNPHMVTSPATIFFNF